VFKFVQNCLQVSGWFWACFVVYCVLLTDQTSLDAITIISMITTWQSTPLEIRQSRC